MREVENCYIFAPSGLACIIQFNETLETISYVHTDHLGSIIGLTDELGQVIPGSVNSFDAWGRRRDPNTGQIISNFSQPLLFDRGYTGHEHLTEFNLINMNGRVYDPTIMRFLSPDPFIQAPDFSQSFNRYSYVMNNPINLIDLSGYTWEDYEDIPPDVDDELRAILEQSGYTFDEVVVTATRINPMEEIWKMHDGFEFDREYDGYDAENNRASGQVGKSWLSKAWNSDIARFYIPDVVYVNGSGVLTFLGGGGVDAGLALPLRGKSAGTVYLYSALKGKAGLHGGVSVNIGRSNYLGPANLFDFTTTFGGKSSGVEGDYILGVSISASEYDRYGNSLLSIDIGVGPGIGGSVNIGAVTYTYPLFRIW